MKKLLSLMAAMLLVVSLAACQSESDTDGESVSPPASSQTSNEETPESVPEPSVEPEIPQDTESEPSEPVEPDQRQVLMTIDGQSYEITLYENPVADALYDLLPLEVTFEDYNSVEKIAYLQMCIRDSLNPLLHRKVPMDRKQLPIKMFRRDLS